MELNEALARLAELQKKLYAYQAADSALYLDGTTVAPKDTAEGRGVALGILAGERHRLFSAPETGELLDFLWERGAELDQLRRRQVEELRRSYAQLTRIPAEEYMEYAMLTNEAGDVWHRAKEAGDFELFRPLLEKLVAFNIRFAGYYDSTKAPYDALLNEYERGVDTVYLDGFFAALRGRIVPLLRAIGEKEQPDDSFLYRHYPVEAQRKFSDYLMEVLGLDRAHCTIGETEHPYTTRTCASPPTTTRTTWAIPCIPSSTRGATPSMSWAYPTTCSTPAWRGACPWASMRASPGSTKT